MRKKSIIRFDKERNKYRVDTGHKLNQYVIRTESLASAVSYSICADRCYDIGYKEGHGKGFCDGFNEGYQYAIEVLKKGLDEL